MEWIDAIAVSPLTPITLSLSAIAIIITSFARGWIVSRFTVETLLSVQNLRISEAIKRGDDYKAAWELEQKRAEVLQNLVENLASVGVTVDKILTNLPAPRSGSGGRVDS